MITKKNPQGIPSLHSARTTAKSTSNSFKTPTIIAIAMKGLIFCTLIVVSIAGFLAPNAAAGQLTLNWTDNSDNESGFRIERSTEGVSFTEIGTVGANTTLFVDTFVTSFTAYSYRVRAYNSSGNSNYSNVRNSSLDLLQQPGSNDRLIGTSIRAQVKKDSGTMIAGFVIKGTGNKQVLLRAVGPSLADYGVSGVINDPRITLYQGNTIIASNDNWSTSSNTALISTSVEQIGIFQLPQGSKDAALLLNLSPGAYTAHITGVDGATGAALVEVYDADEAFDITSTSNLTAISMRGEIGTGSDVVIAGFVVAGSEPKRLLIRVVGPELSHFGVPGALNDPLLKLYKTVNGETFEISSNNDWGTNASQITTVSNQVGVSALDEGSKSAALVIWLEPGVYTVHSTSSSGSGVALVEVYEAP